MFMSLENYYQRELIEYDLIKQMIFKELKNKLFKNNGLHRQHQC